MLTKTECERRLDSGACELTEALLSKSATGAGSTSLSRRLRRQRRESAGAYRGNRGWSVGLW